MLGIRGETEIAPAIAARREKPLIYPDVLRAFAIILVVLLHVGNTPLKDSIVGSSRWWAGNLYDGGGRCCVPLFIMISGALLLDPSKRESLSTFFFKRFVKVIVPFLAWTLIFLAYRRFVKHDLLPRRESVRQFLAGESYPAGPVYYHLWFIYTILALYLATPILRVFVRAANRTDLLYLLGLWFFGNSLLPVFEQYLHFELGIEFFIAEGYLGYFVLGYFLREQPPLPVRWLAAAALAGVGMTLLATYILSRRAHHTDTTFYAYLMPNVVLVAAALFLFARDLPHERWRIANPRLYALIGVLSSTSFSVYLLHPIILESFQSGRLGVTFTESVVHPLVGVPLLAGAVIGVCGVVTVGLRRVPLMKWVLP